MFRFLYIRGMKRLQGISLLTLLLMLVLLACEKDEGCGASNISKTGSTKSHNMGQNCMNCHQASGEGKGCFVVAGTVYTSSAATATAANGTIFLYTGPNATGTLVATIQVDAKGNFHTTDAVNFGSGLYPVVKSASGAQQFMGSSITQGACSGCHGVTTDRIWVN